MPVNIGSLVLYSVKELSDKLGVTEITLREYIKQGKLKGQKAGGRWFISEENIRDFFNNSAITEDTPNPSNGKEIPKHIKPILKRVRQRLEEIYGNRLSSIILYGSYARSDWDEGSDIDLLILLKNMEDPVKELERCSLEIHEIDFEYDTIISIIPMDADEYNSRNLPLILNAKREGIAV